MRNLSISLDQLAPWVSLEYDRSSGPGGQNVNKLNTRATLLLDFEACPHFAPDDRARIRSRLARRLDAAGRVRVVAQSERSQSANRAAAESRLIELLTGALHREKPRRATRPTAASRVRRLAAKRRKSETKRHRGLGESGD